MDLKWLQGVAKTPQTTLQCHENQHNGSAANTTFVKVTL